MGIRCLLARWYGSVTKLVVDVAHDNHGLSRARSIVNKRSLLAIASRSCLRRHSLFSSVVSSNDLLQHICLYQTGAFETTQYRMDKFAQCVETLLRLSSTCAMMSEASLVSNISEHVDFGRLPETVSIQICCNCRGDVLWKLGCHLTSQTSEQSRWLMNKRSFEVARYSGSPVLFRRRKPQVYLCYAWELEKLRWIYREENGAEFQLVELGVRGMKTEVRWNSKNAPLHFDVGDASPGTVALWLQSQLPTCKRAFCTFKVRPKRTQGSRRLRTFQIVEWNRAI